MMNSHSDTSDATGEGVWAPDIEKAFLEALDLFPPCGRRKHILQEEGGGKMYGRNELIAKYIKDRTGCERTRKQVSSHIQVLARRKARTETSRSGGEDSEGAGSSSPASGMSIGTSSGPNSHQYSHHDSLSQHSLVAQPKHHMSNAHFDVWFDRPIATKTIRLVEFSAYFEYRKQQLQLQSNMPPATTAASHLHHHPSAAITLAGLVPGTSPHGDGPVPMDGVTPSNPYVAAAAAAAAAGLSQPPHSSPHPIDTHNHHSISGHHYFGHQAHETYSTRQTNGLMQLQQPLHSNQQHQQQMNQRIDHAAGYTHLASNGLNPFGLNYPQQAVSAGITRHSYVKIDYRQPACRQSNKLERIDLNEFQDKFPEMLGPGGLYQRGSPDAFYLVKFWADMNVDHEYNMVEDQNSNFNFSCSFETLEPFKYITCSTKACSYGAQVVEKVDKIHGALAGSHGKYSYTIDKSPMCEFMIDFIKKLRQLPRVSQMNSVLENFSVLQVVTSESSSEVLLCLGFVFEISSEQHKGSQYRVYKLTKD